MNDEEKTLEDCYCFIANHKNLKRIHSVPQLLTEVSYVYLSKLGRLKLVWRIIKTLTVDFPVSRNFNCNVEKLKGEWCRLVPAEEVEKLQQRNDKLSAAIKKFVHRCEIGEIRSRKTYAEFCALLEESAQRK